MAMHAAAPLPLARVHVVNGRLAIDWLTIEDETTVRLATELGRELNVPMRLANLTLEELTEALSRGWGERDSRVAES